MRARTREKTAEILHRLAAEFVRDESSKASLITVTRVELSDSGKEARILFTTLPAEAEDTALKFLERKAPDFKREVLARSRLGQVPHLSFGIDVGERHRERLDELSREEERRHI